MQQPDFTPLPWRVEYDGQSIVMLTAADGGVLLCDSSGDWPEGVAEYIVQCVNAYPVIAHVHRRLMNTYTPEDATPLHEELLPLLREALDV